MKILRRPSPRWLAFLLTTLPSILLAASSTASKPATPAAPELIAENIAYAAAQYTRLLERLKDTDRYPRSFEHGRLRLVRPTDWTSGFLPGSLWYLFEATGDTRWRDAAQRYTEGLEELKDHKGTHDLGFMLYCSYGNGLRLTGDPKYREVLLTGAESLSTRFNPKVGAIKSWDSETWKPAPPWKYPVIIDNMMNLELLTWATEAGRDPRFRAIAVAHADTTLRHHFRPDASSYHVVDYSPATGEVVARQTRQGTSDDSAWSRGQAWGLYGYTMMYRETKDRAYLEQARQIAAFFMHHPRLPADKVPYWDFDAKDIPHTHRDASAAAIVSSALFELSTFVDPKAAVEYRAFAEAQLRSLASPAYRAPLGENGGFLIMHCVGDLPRDGEIDAPLIYADYYFLEALLRLKASP
jgi:unsaturated chondroitin disaccharide hydrolase